MDRIELKVRIKGGKHDGKIFTLTKPRVVIGRAADCELRLQSAGMGAHHCELRANGEDVKVINLDGVSGTLVNEKPVEEAILATGDVVTAGPLKFEVFLHRHVDQSAVEIEERPASVAGGKPASAVGNESVLDWLS